jgi:hypothetical protein
MDAQFSRIGLLALMAAFVVGVSIAKRGGAMLTPQQYGELALNNPDFAGIALGLLILGSAYLAARAPVLSACAAVVLTAAWALVMLPKFNRPTWPIGARRRLVLGNLIMTLGATAFALLSAAGVR